MRRMRHLRPREIQRCALALDASIATSLYDATSGGSLVAADGAVARWEDQSMSPKNAQQATNTLKPLRRVANINGLDALDFDGGDRLDLTNAENLLRNRPGSCMSVVAKRDSTTASGTNYRFYGFVSRNGSLSATRLAIAQHISTDNRSVAIVRRVSSDAPLIITSSVDDGTGAAVLSVVTDYTTANTELFRNAVSVATGTLPTSGNVEDLVSAASAIGGVPYSGGSEVFGNIGEVCIWDIALPIAIRMRWDQSRMRKWRITQ